MAVVVVTDSSARLPAAETHRWDIRVAPLHVLVDGHDLCDGVDDVPADLYTRGHVTTAGATPAELSALYRQAVLDSGGDGVVAVHISGALSSTLGAAEHAAAEFAGLVRVVDSKSAAMGTGFVALAAARAAAGGADLNDVAVRAQAATAEVRSACSWGLMPLASAARAILRPCSSVPVRKNTSLSSRRAKRARTSVAIAV